MKTLGASIVQRGIASVSDVEEALARQVMYGGDLATNLLELTSVSEAELTRLLASSNGMAAAPSGELPRAPEALRRLVPGELASRHGMYPLSEEAGTLAIAVAEPLPQEVEQDLSFALGVKIVQLAAPLVRIRQALARDYLLPLDKRTNRILAKLQGEPTSLSEPPRVDFDALPRPETLPPSAYAGEGVVDMDVPTGPPPEVYPISVPPTHEPPEVLAGSSTRDTTRDSRPAFASHTERAAAQAPNTTVEPQGRSVSRPQIVALHSAARELARESNPPEVKAHRRLGPYTAADAERDLLNADGRDDVLNAFFDFAAQYFEYCALFVMHGDLAEGRDARGPGASPEQVRALGIPLDLPSAIQSAYERGKWQLVRLTGGGIDVGLAKDLRRPSGPQCLLLPIIMRKRCVLILYGDHGEDDVRLQDVGDVISFSPLVASGLERVILKRKRSIQDAVANARLQVPVRVPRRTQPPLPTRQERAQALADALEAPLRPEAERARLERAAPVQSAASAQSVPSQERQRTPPIGTSMSAAVTRQSAQPEPPAPETRTGLGERQPTPEDDGDGRISVVPQRVLSIEPPPVSDELSRTQMSPRSSDRPSQVGDEATFDSPGAPEIAVGSADIDQEVRDAIAREQRAPLAPQSRAASHSARPPSKRQSSEELRLPSVIVDFESDCRALVHRLCAGDHEAADKLAEMGAKAVSALVAEFPGPLTSELRRAGDSMQRASECGPVLRTLVRIGSASIPFLVVRTADTDPQIRAWATRLLGELPSRESAVAIAKRLIDSDQEVRRAALAAARAQQREPGARAAIRDYLTDLALDAGRSSESRHAAVEALSDIRDPDSVPSLIRILADSHRELAKSAHWGLAVLTRTDLGSDTRNWEKWWRKNAGRHRIEWLIDALMHENPDIRRAAGDELKNITKEYFGYYDDLPKRERAAAQARYRQWWETKGKDRFG